MQKRRKTRMVRIGSVRVGGNAPVSIQSMVKTETRNASAVVSQIKRLEKAGCEIIRVAVKNAYDVRAIKSIKNRINLPLVADIHFDHRLALGAIIQGADAIRLNPGNISKKEKIRKVIDRAKEAGIPIRIGINSGSLKESGLSEDKLMIKSALRFIKHFEEAKFYDIIISLKSSSLLSTMSAYKKMANLCNYPFHLGVTATGVEEDGIIKSSIGIGSLLSEGIGDTIRVSLTADPASEIKAAKTILQSLGIRNFAPEIISCPTCGRCQVDIEGIVKKLRKKLYSRLTTYDLRLKRPITIAVMGCEVNGPGEARNADIGIAAGKKAGMLFKKGRIVKRLEEKDFVKEILKELRRH